MGVYRWRHFALADAFNSFARRKTPRVRNKKKQTTTPNQQKGYEMIKQLSRKTLSKVLQKNKNGSWQTVRAETLTQTGKGFTNPKHTMKFKSLYVCARYWKKELDCETRVIIEPASNGRTYPRAVFQIRPRQEIPFKINSASKQTREIDEICTELEALIEEIEKLSQCAQELAEALTPMKAPSIIGTDDQLKNLVYLIEQGINERRFSAELREEYDSRPAPQPRTRKDFE